MNDIFSKQIQVYANTFDTVGTVMTLGDFLNDKSHDNEVIALRAHNEAEQKFLKKLFPAATISGTFSKRCTDGLLQYSGLICIDIDGADNPDLAGKWDEVKAQLSKLPQIAYISLSVRGNGLFLIIPLRYPDFHTLHFLQFQEDFRNMGITIDPACKDVSRMRIISYDPQPYTNENAVAYERYKVEEKPPKKPYNPFSFIGGTDDTIGKVARLCATIEANGIDLTADYNEWFRIGCSFASLGEAGREFYHVCSRQNTAYNVTETDKKFNNLLATTSRFSIGTFFKICKEWEVRI